MFWTKIDDDIGLRNLVTKRDSKWIQMKLKLCNDLWYQYLFNVDEGKCFLLKLEKVTQKYLFFFSEEFFIQKGIPRLLIARIINVGTVSLHFYMTSPCKNPRLAKKVCMIRSMEKLWRGNLANPERTLQEQDKKLIERSVLVSRSQPRSVFFFFEMSTIRQIGADL